ncbi:M23 family peptidase [Echinicola strongylocentroti]|uniref:M23 family peptidase n=1 Tax=Echinicola strongylocentroti TaxID=1795355 RepID=A0A2Z4IHZ5_9BACT|nr:M23 family metallopeptidase [Echinicola strongylocentroti]AWW30327.1 M23 family peptidase [Echinicola strongylocentroti]
MGIQQKVKNWIENKYLFVIRREEDFSVITSLSINKVRVGLIVVFTLLVFFLISLILSRTLLASWFDPAYLESENMKKIYSLSQTVDSLLVEVEAKDRYLDNIQRIISGDYDVDSLRDGEDTLPNRDLPVQTPTSEELYKKGDATQEIIDEFEAMPPDEGSFQQLNTSSFTETFFFSPIKGVVSAGIDLSNDHFGVDLVSEENEPVKSVAEGTVVMASWTLETGYVIAIQHSNELISIYKHNSVLLKSVGDSVSGGEVISVIGNTGEQTTGQHLHFELWYKGNPLNPQEFITFD